jgi:hypothetical protein
MSEVYEISKRGRSVENAFDLKDVLGKKVIAENGKKVETVREHLYPS